MLRARMKINYIGFMKCHSLAISRLVSLFFLIGCSFFNPSRMTLAQKARPYQVAPFKKLDRLCTEDWWNRKANDIIDLKVDRKHVIAFGLYTQSNGVLKLTAQTYPLYPEETRELRLEILRDGQWVEIQRRQINAIGWSALFRIENWDSGIDVPYRIRHAENAKYEGLIRKDPINQTEISIAALSCNSNKDRGDREAYVRNINFQDPDIVFFAGDQSYDHREHTAAWLKFGMQFRELFRERPCVVIPDDHDVGMYNLWGEGGKKAKGIFGFSGGYRFHPEYVKMVERCQTGHLPDAYDSTSIEQGIGVYYTSLLLGGVDFAIIEDRKFKSGPKGKIPHTGFVRSDHIKKKKYDPADIDIEGLSLLGARQLKFLNEWAEDHSNSEFKVVLSATGFCGGAHLHGKRKQRPVADLDSNGWPQTGRNKALEAIKSANAIHIAGDQHLATLVQHGILDFGDGPWAFVVPAVVNSIYSRWWWPEEVPTRRETNQLEWTGDYLDGFANKISMKAYANPDGPANGAGYGLVRLNKQSKEVTFECWPRNVNVPSGIGEQFLGWPVTITVD